MSDLSKTPILFTPPEVRRQTFRVLAQHYKSTLFCRLILSGPGARGKVPDGWLMCLHQGFIPDGRLEPSIYVQRQLLSPLYLLALYNPPTKLRKGQKETFVTNDL